MPYMSVTADQMSSAAGYLRREWGDYGYRFEDTHMTEPTAAETASGVEYADVRLYAETCPCGKSVAISDHSHDSHWGPQ